MQRGTNSRFTFDPADDRYPVFSPDGKQIAFASNRAGSWGVYVKSASGVGAEQLLQKVQTAGTLGVADWSPDAKTILYNALAADSGYDTWALPLAGDRKPIAILSQKFNEYRTRLSPDGKWLLYTSNETGRDEIYVRAFPPSGGKWQVSVDGGNFAYWRRDGKEIVFDSIDRKIMAVDVKLGEIFEAGVPRPLFSIPGGIVGLRFAMTADAQRFLVPLAPQSGERPSIRTVLNWSAGLKK